MPPSQTTGAVTVRTSGPESRGGAVGHLPDGRAVFVAGALPGELVEVEVTEERERFAFGRTVAVLEASDGRVEPACPAVAAGCGGCDLQHATVALQQEMKLGIVHDALVRIGRLEPPDARVVALPADGFRTTIRAAVEPDGRAGYRLGRSHDVVVPDSCLVAHPSVERLLVGSRFPAAREVTIRVGARTGEALVVVDPVVAGATLASDVVGAVAVDLHAAADAHVHEEVAGRRWRISGASFFQSRPDGADALVAEVAGAVAELVGRPSHLVDLCAGVGLFAGTVDADRVTAVEEHPAAVHDARANLADLGAGIEVIAETMERWRPAPADVVVADPPRTGLRRRGVEQIAATDAELVVLVSCDAGSLGRDAGLLAAAGYRLERVVLVDLFPHTHHVEVVTTYLRT